MTRTSSRPVRSLAEEVWSLYSDSRQWPERKPLIVRHRARGVDLRPVLACPAFSTRTDDVARVRLTAVGLAEVPAALEYLAPLEELLQSVVQRFVDAVARGEEGVQALPDDFHRAWGDSARGAEAARLIFDVGGVGPFRGGGHSGDFSRFYFDVRHDALPYEDCDLPTILAGGAKAHADFDTEGRLSAGQSGILASVHSFALEHGEWPGALRFAVQERKKGDVQRIVNSLAPRFVRSDFSPSGEIQLTLSGLEIVDKTRDVRRTLMRIINALPEFWVSGMGDTVLVDDKALRSRVDGDQRLLRAAKLYLRYARCCKSRSVGPGSEWVLEVDEGSLSMGGLRTFAQLKKFERHGDFVSVLPRGSGKWRSVESGRSPGKRDAVAAGGGEVSRMDAQLAEALEQINPGLAANYEQALNDLADASRSSYLGAAAGLREVLSVSLRILAPDEMVVKDPGYRAREDGKVTRQLRVDYLVRSRPRNVRMLTEVASKLDALAEHIYDRTSRITHLGHSEREELVTIELYLRALLRDLLT